MNANELADEFKNRDWDEVDVVLWCEKAATKLREQAERINNLIQWEKRHLDVIEAQKKLIEAQDKHIVDLAFKLVYAERGNEVAKELSK